MAGGRGTLGEEVVVSGLADRLAFSASQLHDETDGFGGEDRSRKYLQDFFCTRR